ncbi:MAG: beta-propeller domain-containing protein [Clostridia bacterium]|nr:beta-propeller domain-containing protein [Clostridia bacterium]
MSDFKESYRQANQALQGDAALDERVLSAMNEAAAPARKHTRMLRRTLAIAACLALLVATGVLFYTPNRSLPTRSVNGTTYADVYSVIRQMRTESGSLFSRFVLVTERLREREFATDTALPDQLDYRIGEDAAKNQTAAEPSGDHSETTHQVEGVDEGDFVKTDGRYIYSIGNGQLRILAIDGGKIELQSTTTLDDTWASEMYVTGDTLVLVAAFRENNRIKTRIVLYDVADRTAPQKRSELTQSGYFMTSRLADGRLVTVSYYDVPWDGVVETSPETYVPLLTAEGKESPVKEDNITLAGDPNGVSYVVTTVVRLDQPDEFGAVRAVFGCGNTVYMNRQNLYLGWTCWDGRQEKTRLFRLAVGDGSLDVKAEGSVPGWLLNQFSMDEYDGHLRVVTTTRGTTKNEGISTLADGKVVYENVVVDDVREIMPASETAAALYVLDEDLAVTGKIEDLAPGERVYSVRFDGQVGYFVTFRETDPLFSADLSDPANPRILGELKIPGFSNYLYPYGEGLLLGFGFEDGNVKLSMFDISDPANVTEIAKEQIEGAWWSAAQYNHKAMLADPVKNLIGFESHRIGKSGTEEFAYLLYCFENGRFVPVKEISLQDTYVNDARGLYVGDWFYLAADRLILPLSLRDLSFGEPYRFEGYDDPFVPFTPTDPDMTELGMDIWVEDEYIPVTDIELIRKVVEVAYDMKALDTAEQTPVLGKLELVARIFSTDGSDSNVVKFAVTDYVWLTMSLPDGTELYYRLDQTERATKILGLLKEMIAGNNNRKDPADGPTEMTDPPAVAENDGF